MDSESLFYSFFLIFTGSAMLATVALFSRQPLIVAYIILGGIFGPSGMALITDTELLSDTAHAGILFLLFLLGLDMQPGHLVHMLHKTAFVGLFSSAVFAIIGYGCAWMFGFSNIESLVIGGTMMFSSTIIGIKLLPTKVLHHKRTGELLVSLLLLQDLLAILMLLVLYNSKDITHSYLSLLGPLVMLPLLALGAWCCVKYVLLPLMTHYDHFHEYLFLLAIGWCLGLGELAHSFGLSTEIGAFVAGVSIATSPISQYIAINLKPLRDFFLVLFFFSVGANFNLALLPAVILPGMVLALCCLLLKPPVFWLFLQGMGEQRYTAWEVGVRLGQNSEFALLVALVATTQGLIDTEAAHVVKAATILTLLISSYIVVFKYESPIAISDRLRRS